MAIKFTKMHGLGNDFMVIDGINQRINLRPEQISALAQRHTGIGFDQLLLVEASHNPDIDFNYRVFNADGHEVGQCGNGARALAAFARYYGLTQKDTITVATKTTQMCLQLNADNSVSVTMGIPNLLPAKIPFVAAEQADKYQLELSNKQHIAIHALSVGNPHAVLVVENTENYPVQSLGQQISNHPLFPEQVNVGFMQIMTPEHMRLRVYERGCGETLACGSGAVAAAAIGRLYYNMKAQIRVTLAGGDLLIDWPQTDAAITLTGPAVFVYEGTIFS